MASIYATTLNTRPFLYQETLQIARLFNEGKTEKEIETEIYEYNLFQIKNKDRMKTFYNEIKRRLSFLDTSLLEEFLSADKQTSKAILLWAIVQRDRLFFEWMKEVVREKMLIKDLCLNQKETAYFMIEKKEQIPAVAKWTEETTKRLINAYHQTLVDAELAEKEKDHLKLLPPLLSFSLQEQMREAADDKYLDVLIGG